MEILEIVKSLNSLATLTLSFPGTHVTMTIDEVIDMVTPPPPAAAPRHALIPRRLPTEVWHANGRTCPVCWRLPKEQVAILACDHFICGECYDKMTKLDREHIAMTGGVDGEIAENGIGPEAVRRAEGADKCPMCRAFSHVTTLLRAE